MCIGESIYTHKNHVNSDIFPGQLFEAQGLPAVAEVHISFQEGFWITVMVPEGVHCEPMELKLL